jgi:hypothetical protein
MACISVSFGPSFAGRQPHIRVLPADVNREKGLTMQNLKAQSKTGGINFIPVNPKTWPIMGNLSQLIPIEYGPITDLMKE